MIFAEMQYDKHYSEIHADLVKFVQMHFSTVQFGLQGDSWIWIFNGSDKVEIDTFSSMRHQVKCASADSQLVTIVIEKLLTKYKLHIYPEPELEVHE